MKYTHYGITEESLHEIAQELAPYHNEKIPPDYWHGYFTAVATSPVIIPESTWEKLLFNNKSVDLELKDRIRNSLSGISEELYKNSFYPYFPGNAEDWRECRPAQWCDGFLTACHLWPEDIQSQAGEELVMLVTPILIFHNPEQYAKNTSNVYNESEWEHFLNTNFKFLRQGLFEILQLWQEVLED